VHRYVDDSHAPNDDVIDDDVTAAGGDGASEMSFTNSDCSSGHYIIDHGHSRCGSAGSSGLYVVNCGQYHVGGVASSTGAAHSDSCPQIVAFRTFLPPVFDDVGLVIVIISGVVGEPRRVLSELTELN